MWRLIFIAFLFAHALIHLAIWASGASKAPNAPFDARHSWLLGDQRALSVALAIVTAAALLAGGVGLWAHAGWWRRAAGRSSIWT